MPKLAARAAVDESQWARLSDALGEQMGLYYPKERWGDLELGIATAAQMFGKSVEACVDWLLLGAWSRQQIEVLASCLTIGETYFYREKRSFDILRSEILPPLLRARQASERRLRIWSAGCCTGEEPYSIAMSLASAMPDIDAWNISILATDIDPNFLRRAATGIYSQWSFRDAPADIQRRYFNRTRDGRFEIAHRIRDLVTFAYLNLADDSYPSVANGTNAMDIVFCRNVLMYFEPARAADVLQRLGWSLLEGGWLFLNPVEIPHLPLAHLQPIHFGDVIAHRKGGAGTAEPRPVPWRIATVREADSSAVPVFLPDSTPATTAPAPWIAETAPLEPIQPEPALPITPTAPMPPPHAAAAAYAEGRYAQAAQAALDRLAIAPDDIDARVLLAKSYANQGHLAQALQCCEQVIAVDKLNAQWRHLAATILQELGKFDDAADELRCALYLDPDDPLLHFSLGTLLRRQGFAEDARRQLHNALALLERCAPEQRLSPNEALSARRLAEIIRATLTAGAEQ